MAKESKNKKFTYDYEGNIIFVAGIKTESLPP